MKTVTVTDIGWCMVFIKYGWKQSQ